MTDHFQAAVTAVRKDHCRLCANRVPLDATKDYHDHGEDGMEACRARPRQIAEDLTLALPHLRRMMADQLRAEAERLQRLQGSHLGPDAVFCAGYKWAAIFIEEEPK